MGRQLSVTQSAVRKRWFFPLLVAAAAAASLLAYAFAAGMLYGPIASPGTTPPELLNLENYTVGYDANQPNPTVLTMTLRNSGTSTANLSTLTIKDLTSNGNPVTFQLGSQAVGSRGASSSVTVDTLSSGFYFIHGHSYSFTVITSGAQYVFSPENYA